MNSEGAPALAVTTKPEPRLHLAYRHAEDTLWHATLRLAAPKPEQD